MQRQQPVPPIVYVLADHLDGALAACEDFDAVLRQPQASRGVLREFALRAMMHVLRARHHSKELGRIDRRIAGDVARFLAATANVPDAAKKMAQRASGSETFEDFGRFAGGVIDTAAALSANLLDALERHDVLYESASDELPTRPSHAFGPQPVAALLSSDRIPLS